MIAVARPCAPYIGMDMTTRYAPSGIIADCPCRRTFHSDQRWAYQMKSYTNRLKEERIFQSMSRKGNCLDNSVMETFFGLLKQEIYYGRVYHSCEELKQRLRNMSSTTTSAASRSLSAGWILLSTDTNMLLHNKSAGNHFPTLSGLTFWGHYTVLRHFRMRNMRLFLAVQFAEIQT